MKLQLNNIIHNSPKMDVTSLITEESSLRLKVACPKCDSSYIVKNGKSALDDQRYKCKSCGRIFSTHTNSPMSYSKKSKVQWLKYLECMRQGLSIRESAMIVKIHKNTAFYWRHKILNALKEKLSEKLEGVISIDELYINESYKGNHSKNKVLHLMKQRLPHKVKDILIYLDSSRKRLRVCEFKHIYSKLYYKECL